MDDPRELSRIAIRAVRGAIRWKPGKGTQHLTRRIARRHLREDATLEDYEGIIRSVVNRDDADVYLFEWEGTPYPAIVASVDDVVWLVMTSAAGIMETAFVVDEDGYLDQERFTWLGRVQEIMS